MTLKTILTTFLLVAASFTIVAQSSTYTDLVGDADKAIAEGKWGEAEKLLVEAMRLEPANPFNVLLMSNVGMMQFNQGKDSLALATLNDAHEIAPASVTILGNRARILMATGHEKEAFDDFGRIIELDSTAVMPRFNHGIIALKMRDIATATRDFEYLDTHAPDELETSIGMATLHSALGNWAEAIPYFNRVIEKDPASHFYSGRALCRLMLDQLSEASDDIARGLELDPEDGELYLYRAALNKMRYRVADARADAERARQLGIPAERLKDFFK